MNTPAKVGTDIDTIVWDLDGTLLDSFGIYQECLNTALCESGRPEAPEHILRHNHHGTMEEALAGVLGDMGENATEAEMAKILEHFFILDNAYIKDADHHLFEDAIDLAERAHKAGKKQIIVTNRAHGVDRQNGSPRNIVQNSRLRHVISDVLCGDESPYRKPRRQVLEARFGAGLSALGNIVVIGDQFVDAEFARNIGCQSVLVKRTDAIAHLDKLIDWETYVQIVPSLRSVEVAPPFAAPRPKAKTS